MKTLNKLLVVFILITLIKTLSSYFVVSPSIFTDEYLYLKMGQSFFQSLTFNIHGLPSDTYLPIYPIITSLAFLLKQPTLIYLGIKIINSILSTLIIIPAYLLAKEFLDEKKSFITAIIVGLLPMNVIISTYIMSENLFYTLFLTSIYFIYKSFTNKSYIYDILAGIFIGLSMLTRLSGTSLIMIVILTTLYRLYKKDYNEIKKKIIMGIITIMIILPWLIRNGLIFGFTKSGLLGNYSNAVQNSVLSYPNLFIWVIIYLGFIILSSCILLFALNFIALKEKLKREKTNIFTILSFITFGVIIIALSKYAAASSIKQLTLIPGLNGRPIGRYIDTVLPLLTINGLITYYNYKDKIKTQLNKVLLVFIPIILISSQLMFFSLFPLNNLSVAEIGVVNFILEKFTSKLISVLITTIIIIGIIIGLIILNKKNILRKYNIIKVLAIIFIVFNIINYSLVIYNSKTWYNHPQEQLSLWINENIHKDKLILIDKEDCGIFTKETPKILCTPKKATQLTALWIINPVIIEDIKTPSDYIITSKKLDLELIKKTENDIYLYKSK